MIIIERELKSATGWLALTHPTRKPSSESLERFSTVMNR